MWKNIVERGRPQMAIWRMRIACWITNATNTHSPHITLIAFPPQQWLRERTSMLRYTHIACLARLPITQNGPPSQHPAVQLTIPRHLVPKARTEWSCTSVSICILMAWTGRTVASSSLLPFLCLWHSEVQPRKADHSIGASLHDRRSEKHHKQLQCYLDVSAIATV